MTLLFLVTHTCTHRWQGIRLRCPFHYVPLSCWPLLFNLMMCINLRFAYGVYGGPKGYLFDHSYWSNLSCFYLFISVFAFGLPTSLCSFIPLLCFMCIVSLSLSLLMCYNIVGTEEIFRKITTALFHLPFFSAFKRMWYIWLWDLQSESQTEHLYRWKYFFYVCSCLWCI